MFVIRENDVIGFLRSGLDAHTMGVNAAAQLVSDCGYRVAVAPEPVCMVSSRLESAQKVEEFLGWICSLGITVLSCSYRLDPREGAEWFGRIIHVLKNNRLFEEQGGSIRFLFFAGLPETCALVKKDLGAGVDIFPGGETPKETLIKFGIPLCKIPNSVSANSVYDEARLAFGRELINSGKHLLVKPYDRTGYETFGTHSDSLVERLKFAKIKGELPLFRAHVGPYSHDRGEAVRLFLDWGKSLASSGFLDVLSIGSSQLTQQAFGEDWTDRPNGGGVPINSEKEFCQVYEATRPMLVRTYAGTKNLPQLAEIYNRTINNAWHALSLWWFCKLDGRGDYTLLENLKQQFAAIKVAARAGKPFEPNVPHHFSFRGGDDVTYIVSAVIATRVAKKLGIRVMILQNMMNTPANTWGTQDLAKARAMLSLVREYEDSNFRVVYQPRTGLGYFAPDIQKAKIQLAAATVLMDDVEPHNDMSPDIIHVVSYSEAVQLATPEIINESIQITRAALAEYRKLRRRGLVDDMFDNAEVRFRQEELIKSVRNVMAVIDSLIPNLETPTGLYKVFRAGFLPVPDLLNCREEFPLATMWKTKFVNGGYRVVSSMGSIIPTSEFAAAVAEKVKEASR